MSSPYDPNYHAQPRGGYAPDEVECNACGCTIDKDDAERIDDGAGRKGYYYLCAECADGVRHYQAVSK